MSIELIYNFDPEKNARLISLRGISFEEIILALDSDKLLDIIIHPNQATYPNQKIYIIELNEYAYLVPLVETGNTIFLKTAFPSRKATKYYLTSRGEK